MIRRIKRLRPTYAGVASTLALVLALGIGGAHAADKIGSKQIAASAVKTKHIKDGQVKTRDLGANVKAPSARSADQATNAASADQATNAANLGGEAPSAYQRHCFPGAIKGSIVFDTSDSQTPTYVNAPVSFNCRGGAVQIRRTAIGTYFVRFADNPLATSAVATASPEGAVNAADNHVIAVERVNDPAIEEAVFRVRVYANAFDGGSTLVDGRSFTLLAY